MLLCHPLLLLACALPAHPQDADWPHFLGPARNGVSSETAWSPQGAAEPLWTKNVGAGYSCPSIADGKLVTMGYDGEGQDVVWCLDPRTGEELWTHRYAANDAPRYHGGGTLTTPAIDGGTVFTLNRHGQALALDLATGAVQWQRDLREDLGLGTTFHGYCASPVVVGERILYVLGGTALLAKRDGGEVIWRTADRGDGAYTNPTLIEHGGQTKVAVMLGQVLVLLDLETGDVVHEFPWPLSGNAVHVAQPLAIGDRLLVSTAYGKGSAMIRLGSEREPEVLWTTRALRNKVTGIYHHRGHLYGFDESMLKCFTVDGEERWRVRGLGMGALSIAGDRLLVLSSRGELIVAEASPEEFRELSREKVLSDGDYWTLPVLVQGRIYVRNSLGDLACLDHSPTSAAANASDPVAGQTAPSAEELLAGHSRQVGAEHIRSAHGLDLQGRWEIPGRGQDPTPATLSFQSPNRWRIGNDGGGRVHTFDGELGWELLNGGPRLYEGPEAEEAPLVFQLQDVFAPSPPPGARTLDRPVSFLGRPCWAVEARWPVAGDEEPTTRSVRYYFDVETRRLVGREGDRMSTLAFHGRQPIGEASLPERITIYRVGNGQEETFYVSAGTWAKEPPAPFQRPEALLRMMRTPEEIARDEKDLRDRFGDLLGRYRTTDTPDNPREIAIAVKAGDLVLVARGRNTRLVRQDGPTEAFELLGVGASLTIRRDGEGAVIGADLNFGPDTIPHVRVVD